MIKDGVPGANKGVSKDPVVGGGTLDTGLADGTSEDGLLEDVDGGRNGIVDSTDGDGDVGKAADTRAVRVDVEHREDLVNGAAGTNDDGGSSVDDTLAGGASKGNLGASNRDRVKLNGVVVALVEVKGVVGDGSSVVRGISATEDEGAAVASGRGVEVEGEDGAGDGTLGDGIVKPGGDVVSRDGLIGKTEDSIKGRSREKVSEGGGNGKLLLLDENTSDRDVIVDECSLHASGSVGDGDGLAVVLVGGGLGAVVLVLSVAALVVAGGGRDPEVGGTSVHDGGKDLRRSSDEDRSIVLGVLGVCEHLDGEAGLSLAQSLLLLGRHATEGHLDDLGGTKGHAERNDQKDDGCLHRVAAFTLCVCLLVGWLVGWCQRRSRQERRRTRERRGRGKRHGHCGRTLWSDAKKSEKSGEKDGKLALKKLEGVLQTLATKREDDWWVNKVFGTFDLNQVNGRSITRIFIVSHHISQPSQRTLNHKDLHHL